MENQNCSLSCFRVELLSVCECVCVCVREIVLNGPLLLEMLLALPLCVCHLLDIFHNPLTAPLVPLRQQKLERGLRRTVKSKRRLLNRNSALARRGFGLEQRMTVKETEFVLKHFV